MAAVTMAGWRWRAARARAVARKRVFRDPARVVAPASLQVGRRGGVPALRERRALSGGAREAGPWGAPRAARASRRPRGPRAGRPLPHGAPAWLLAARVGSSRRPCCGPGSGTSTPLTQHRDLPHKHNCAQVRQRIQHRWRSRLSESTSSCSASKPALEYASFKSQSALDCTLAQSGLQHLSTYWIHQTV